jgi:ring-1,2-phenylacetyl-CoA epoxidase subunit PaaC
MSADLSALSPAARQVILAFADDEHMMGQQHTEWIGVAPFLEEDLAFASIGQDELGHAALLFEVLVGPDDQAIDEIAFYREPDEWRSCHLTEMTLPEWADTLVRHWLYDAAEELRWQLFTESSVHALRNVAARAQQEERFHRRHGDALLDSLLSVDEARDRLVEALHRLLPPALAMFDGVSAEPEAIAEGVVAGTLRSCIPEWKQRVDNRFGAQDWAAFSHDSGDRTTRHAEFAALLARLREVLDLDRTAVW